MWLLYDMPAWPIVARSRRGISMTEQDYRADMNRRVSALEANMAEIGKQVRNTMRWGVGILVVVGVTVIGYLVSDLNKHEALDAHPETKASMAAVKIEIQAQKLATDRIASVVTDNHDLLMRMEGRNGRHPWPVEPPQR